MYIEGLKNTHEQIEEFLQANKHKLVSPEYMFGIDNGQDSLEMWDTCKYRILICFLSPGATRGVSNTFMALRGIIKANMGDDIFIDYSYVPDPDDFVTFKKNKMPMWFGNVSHRPVSEYDMILVSHSIVPESMNFARCLYYSGIPLSRELRFKDEKVPFILYGGAASIVSQNLLGEIPEEYGGGHALYDAATFGFGEDHLDKVVRYLLENNIGAKKDKESILDKATHEFDYLYDPLGYEYTVDEKDKLKIASIKKVKDWLPDKVKICNTYNTNYPGFVHKVFNLDGQNADSSDCQIALGCSGQGACSFCSEGTVAGPFREKDFELVKKDLDETKKMSASNSIGFYAYNLNYYSKIFELLGYAGQNYSSISLINMRVDEIANNPDFLTLAKHMGQIRNSAAIEGCVSPDTLITMADMSQKKIKDIEIGDSILSYNIDKKKCVVQKVTDKFYNGKLPLSEWNSVSIDEHTNYRNSIPRSKRLTVTDNHEFYNGDGFSTVDKLQTVYKLVPVMDSYREEALKGWILSDGYFNTDNQNISLMQKLGEYWEFTKELYRPWYGEARVEISGKGSPIGRLVIGRETHSLRADSQEEFYKQSFRNITPIMFAYMFMGDGACQEKAFVLNLHSMQESTLDVLIDKLAQLGFTGCTKVKDKRCKSGSGMAVRIPTKTAESMIPWFVPYVHPSMRYKLRYYEDLPEYVEAPCVEYNIRPREISVKKRRAYKNGKVFEQRMDLQVENTHCYFANGILVHNCSERIRNVVLNKNLDRKTLMVAVRTVMEQKFIMAKFGMIRTGLETEQDWLEFLDTLEEMLKIRSELGANTAFQFSFTPLVVYGNIPLRYEPRVTAQQSLDDVRNMGWVLEKVRELGDKYDCYIKCKFNGRGPGTFIEQLLLDGGRTFTKPLIRVVLDDDLDYQRNFADKHRDSILKWCAHYGIEPRNIFRERDEDEIFWEDTIQFVTESRLKEWHDMHIKHDYSHGYCLKTNSSPGKCYNCKTCPTPKDIKRIVGRELSHIPVEEVIANLAGQRVRSITRFIINKSLDWKIYSNETLCHYVTSQFLQADESLVSAFHMVGKNNTSWASNNDQKDWFGGYVVCDVEWKDIVTAEQLKALIPKVNEKLHIAKVVEVYDIDKNLELDTKANVSYTFELPGISIGRVSEKLSNFDWMIKTVEKGAAGDASIVKKHMPELKGRILFIPRSNGCLGFMNIPITLNPYYVLSSFMGLQEPVCRTYDMKCIDVGKESDIICKTDKCGKYTNYSYILNKQLNVCPVCRGKMMLYKIQNN